MLCTVIMLKTEKSSRYTGNTLLYLYNPLKNTKYTTKNFENKFLAETMGGGGGKQLTCIETEFAYHGVRICERCLCQTAHNENITVT